MRSTWIYGLMQTQSLARRDCLASRRTRSDTGVLARGPETSKLRSYVLGRGRLSLLICVLTWTELHQGVKHDGLRLKLRGAWGEFN